MSVVALAVEPVLRRSFAAHLHRHGLVPVDVPPGRLDTLSSAAAPSALILSVDAALSGSELTLADVRRRHPHLPLVVIVTHGTEDFAIAALRARVHDYYRASADPGRIVSALAMHLAGGIREQSADERLLVGDAEAIREVRAYIGRVADLDTNVLVTGETGTGKELVATAIHRQSARHARAFVPVNCAAIPESLLESELFGYEKGAFTGANTAVQGKLEQADGGTVFFDEIGEMTRLAQAKILRALETREIVRVGGRRTLPVDVRVIAATNQDLEAAVERGDFRKDLYYRLNVARIHVPPLRLHPEDIPALCAHYLQHFNRRFGRNIAGFTDGAMKELLWYGWPGNVRELKNLLEAVFVNLPDGQITLADLPLQFRAQLSGGARLPAEERHKILDALLATRWNVSRAAQQLHWSRMTMYRKMAKYHLVKSNTCKEPVAR